MISLPTHGVLQFRMLLAGERLSLPDVGVEAMIEGITFAAASRRETHGVLPAAALPAHRTRRLTRTSL
jgi:hypothetical protein